MEKLTFDGYQDATQELHEKWRDRHIAMQEYRRRERAALIDGFEKLLSTDFKLVPIIVVAGLFVTMIILLFK